MGRSSVRRPKGPNVRESLYFILSSYIYNVTGAEKIDYSWPIYSSSSNNEKTSETNLELGKVLSY